MLKRKPLEINLMNSNICNCHLLITVRFFQAARLEFFRRYMHASVSFSILSAAVPGSVLLPCSRQWPGFPASVRQRTNGISVCMGKKTRPPLGACHTEKSLYIMIQTIPPLLSLTIFCMVSCSFNWLSWLIEEILLRIPSCTSCSMDLPNIFVSQIPSSPEALSPI